MKKLYLFLMAALLCVGAVFSAPKKVAFVYVEGYGSNGWSLDIDPVYAALCENFEVTPCPQVDGTEADYEQLKTFDCVVLSEAMSGGKTMSNGLVNLVGQVPMVGMKAHNYTSGRWGWATPGNPGTKTGDFVIVSGFESHPLFRGLEVNADGSISLFDSSEATKNRIQGFEKPIEGSLLAAEQDKFYANPVGSSLYNIHEIAEAEGGKKYVLVSISSDDIAHVNANGQKIIINAVKYVTDDVAEEMVDLNIAYLYDSSYSNYCGIDNDPIANNTKMAEQKLTTIDIKDFTAENVDTLNALQNFDLVVISEAMSSGQKFAIACKQLINRVPILNLKSFIYKKGCWGEGAGVNPTGKAANDGGIAQIAVPEAFWEDALFADIEFESDSLITLFNNYDPETVKKNLVQAYTVNEGSMFENDEVLAKVYNGETANNVIHRHGAKNMYMLISLSSDAMFIEDECNLSEPCLQLINNAVDILAKTKSKVTPCTVPTIAQINGNLTTDVILSCKTDGAAIYYTLDGTDPTEASTLYADTFAVTKDSTVVKAIAFKQGYDASPIASAVIRVYTKPAAPTISVAKEEGKSIVTIEAEAGVKIYYNFLGVDDMDQSGEYKEPVTVTRPMTITAFTNNTALSSETVSEVLEIQGLDVTTLRDHEFGQRFDANTDDWWWETSGGNSKVAYWMGKKAMSMYASIDTIIDPATGDTTYDKHERDLMVWHPKNDSTGTIDNGWIVFTKGQLVQWENTVPVMGVGKGGENAGDKTYHCSVPEDLLYTPTKGHITLTSKYSGEGFNAGIQSTVKFQGPFDIVTCIGNNNGDGSNLTLALAVSEDGENWTPVDTVAVGYYKRYWTVRRSAYDENKEVYVRAMQAGGGTKLAVYDIIMMNNQPDAIDRVISSEIVRSEYYDLNGRRLTAPAAQGITIVKNIHADGNVTAEKVIMR